MSVLIKGMEMPKKIEPGLVIEFADGIDGKRYARLHHDLYGSLTDWLETVPVPSHEIFGTWEWDPDGIDYGLGAWKCSNCGSKAETWWAKDGNSNPLKFAGSHYCGNCGAAMRR